MIYQNMFTYFYPVESATVAVPLRLIHLNELCSDSLPCIVPHSKIHFTAGHHKNNLFETGNFCRLVSLYGQYGISSE